MELHKVNAGRGHAVAATAWPRDTLSMKPLHIGIAACSAEGAALCYRTICTEGPDLMGGHAHPEVTLHTPSLEQYMEHIYAGDWAGVGEMMLVEAAVPNAVLEMVAVE